MTQDIAKVGILAGRGTVPGFQFDRVSEGSRRRGVIPLQPIKQRDCVMQMSGLRPHLERGFQMHSRFWQVAAIDQRDSEVVMIVGGFWDDGLHAKALLTHPQMQAGGAGNIIRRA